MACDPRVTVVRVKRKRDNPASELPDALLVEAAPSSKRRARVDQLAAALDVAHLHARDDLGDGAPPIRNPASTEDAVAVGNTPSIEPLLLQRRVFRRVQTVSSMQLKDPATASHLVQQLQQHQLNGDLGKRPWEDDPANFADESSSKSSQDKPSVHYRQVRAKKQHLKRHSAEQGAILQEEDPFRSAFRVYDLEEAPRPVVQAPPVEQLMCNHMVMLREFVSQLPPEQACAGAQRVAEAERDLHADMAAAPAGGLRNVPVDDESDYVYDFYVCDASTTLPSPDSEDASLAWAQRLANLPLIQVREVDEDWLVAEDEGDGASDSDDSQKEADYPEDESGSDWASDGEEGGDAGAWRSRTTNHQSRWSSDDELDLYGERQEAHNYEAYDDRDLFT